MSALPALMAALPGVDERLTELVRLALRERGIRALPGLAIETEQATVKLRGPVHSFYEKQLVLHAVLRVPGVVRIVDEIDVLSGSGR
jgi:osmotically-inducible protein OsmY